jgi:hypothetical protein
MKFKVFAIPVFFFLVCAAFAQAPHATVVREATLYLSPDTTSAKMAQVARGRNLVLLETTPGWVHVEAVLPSNLRPDSDDDEDQPQPRVLSGWIVDKGVVRASTPNGDRIIFGAAADAEDQASRRGGRNGAAADARWLYYRVYDLFPNSPLAGESLYRAADVQWQVEKADIMSRPSSHEQSPNLRDKINEDLMKEVIKKFPNTKWADLAAFHMIDNKLCGDWQGASKCPEKEAGIYEKYASDHPQSPAAAEALYDAAWRWSALIVIYKAEGDAKKSEQARQKALEVAQKAAQFKDDWGARAQALLYLVQQNVPTYGDQRE